MVAYPLLPLWHPRGKKNFFAAGPKPRLRQQARAPDWGPMETLGLIAGNGRFPFLVLDAARSLGTKCAMLHGITRYACADFWPFEHSIHGTQNCWCRTE